ncbi:MAG: hypothetical protein ISF22_04855 [Methanomassiliicoccus sp.]|nr:hypothetical protein [Methanomassiliicoccus sp.]
MAFSFLICIPFIVYLKRERALALSYLMFFALLPDFLHLGPLRFASHSFVGLAFMLLIALVPLIVISRPRAALVLLAVTASYTHLMADGFIGSVAPFWPWSTRWFQINEFNSAYDIQMELVLLALSAVILVIAMRPWEALKNVSTYSKRERRGLFLTSLPMAAMSGLQGVYFIIVSEGPGLGTARTALLAAFGIIFLASSILLLASIRGSRYG